jgi:hypothetical protein
MLMIIIYFLDDKGEFNNKPLNIFAGLLADTPTRTLHHRVHHSFRPAHR